MVVIWQVPASDLQCAGAGFSLQAKTSEIQRVWLLICVYEGALNYNGVCLGLIFHQSVPLKLRTFCFPDGTAKELVPSGKG